jgi:site-specific recombinase XerD
MTGRDETNLQYKENTKKLLSEMPDFAERFYYSMTNMQESSKFTYMDNLKSFFDYIQYHFAIADLGEMFFRSISRTDLEKYIEFIESDYIKKGKKGQSAIALKVFAIKKFFQYLYDEDKIEKNPAEKLKYKNESTENEPTFLTQDEIKELFENIEKKGNQFINRDKLLFLIPMVTGMRVSPLHELNIEDIDCDNKSIVVTEKENYKRIFKLDDNTFEVLFNWIREREYLLLYSREQINALFITRTDKKYNRITHMGIHEIYRKYTKDFDKNITPHMMRRTFANMAYKYTDHDIYAVSAMLGHKRVETTKRYVVPDVSKKKEIAGKIFSVIGGET